MHRNTLNRKPLTKWYEEIVGVSLKISNPRQGVWVEVRYIIKIDSFTAMCYLPRIFSNSHSNGFSWKWLKHPRPLTLSYRDNSSFCQQTKTTFDHFPMNFMEYFKN